MNDALVYQTLQTIVRPIRMEELDVTEVENATKTAFKVIGYAPKNFSESFTKVWRHSVSTGLPEFIHEVYVEDVKL